MCAMPKVVRSMLTLRLPGGGVLAQAPSRATRPRERAVNENREREVFEVMGRA
ncbi:hypothetical protein D3C72_2008640 [compost metagenome]